LLFCLEKSVDIGFTLFDYYSGVISLLVFALTLGVFPVKINLSLSLFIIFAPLLLLLLVLTMLHNLVVQVPQKETN
jgi:hypothetical protein